VIVRVHRGQLTYFRRKAKAKLPNEIMAILVGKHVSKSELEIHYFFYPKKYEVSTPSAVKIDAQTMEEFDQEAKQLGLKIVGSIHSHPYWPPILSPTDHSGHIEVGDKVSGIVEITRDGRTYVAFWRHDSSLRCELKYF
jgi:proteasome lid subunit RPN8/RPN11